MEDWKNRLKLLLETMDYDANDVAALGRPGFAAPAAAGTAADAAGKGQAAAPAAAENAEPAAAPGTENPGSAAVR